MFRSKIGLLYIIFVMLSVSMGYSFPQTEKHPYVGSVVYDHKDYPTGLIEKQETDNKTIVSFYNQYGDAVRKEITTKLKKQVQHYDQKLDVIQKQEIDNKNQLISEILFKSIYKNQTTRKIIVLPENKLIRTDYIYVKDPITGQIKTKLGFNRDKNGNYIYNQHNTKVVFKYYKNGTYKDFFTINHNEPSAQYQFQKSEIYRFNNFDNIISIVFLNKKRQPKKYIHYFYNNRQKLREIQVYEVVNYIYNWQDEIQMIPIENLKLKNSYIYYYTKKIFEKIKQFIVSR